METFKYINREYTPSVDLTTLGKTFDTLEQGHQDAVKAASQLEMKMAELDLNEKEDQWRQEKINSIRKLVDDNTIYGNSYAALDNIIAKAGNIMSDQGMIGRLQAQKDYKTFVNRIENDDTLPQDYKDYFLEKNKYDYKDKFDSKGNIIGGTKWTPSVSPTKIVSLADIIVKGINIAAKESGGSQITRWIDKKGNVTTEPTQAYDGEVYNTTTGSWERLSRKKIWQGINAMIESTPGAKESLAQDYDIAKWRYKKQLMENGNKLFETDVTDENGIPLSPQDYVRKRIDPAVQAASYYNNSSKTTYGDGLNTYKTAMANVNKNKAGTNTGIDNIRNFMSTGTPITMDYDYAGKLIAQKQNATANLIKLYTKYSRELPSTNMEKYDYNQWLDAINNLGDDVNPDVKSSMRTQLRRLNEANVNYSNIESQLDDRSKNDLDFVTRMNNGGNFNNDNPNDKELLKTINGIFGDNGNELQISVYNDDKYKKLITLLDGDVVNGHKKLGITTGIDRTGNKYIRLSKEHYQNIPVLAKILNNEFSDIFVNNYGLSGPGVTMGVLDSSGKYVNTSFNKNTIKNIAQQIDDANERVKKNISDVAPHQITISNENLPKQTFNHQMLYYDYVNGQIKSTDYNIQKSELDDDMFIKLIGHQYTQTEMFAVDEDNSFTTLQRIDNSEDRQEIGTKIINATANKRMKLSAAHNPLYGSGANVTIWDKSDKDGNPVGTPQRYFIPGLLKDEAAKAFDNDPSTIAADKITIGNEVKHTFNITDQFDTPTLGSQQIECLGNNTFKYKNKNKELYLNRNQAEAVVSLGEQYLQVKDRYLSGYYDVENGQDFLDKDLGEIAIGLGSIIYENKDDILGLALQLENDLKE